MSEAQVLVNNTEGIQPICVYRTTRAKIHVIYGYVNISMCVTCFAKLCHSVFQIHNKVDEGAIDAPHITINYSSTTLVLPVDEFCILSDSLAQAQERLEFIEDCDIDSIAATQEELDDIPDIQLPLLPQAQYSPKHIHLN